VLRESLPLPGGVPLDGDETVDGAGTAGAGATTGGTAGEPTRLESAEAFFRDRPRGALFRGDVRAWQGNSVLLAQWLRANDETQELTAGGGVRTVAAQSPTSERPESPPMTVTADEMSYAARGVVEPGAEGGTEVGTANENPELIYRHQVRVEDGQRRVACERLEVFLDEDGRAERLVALEKVVLEDPQTGKEARAQRAVWRPEDRPGGGKVALFGAPAVVRDGRGAEIKAPELIYDLITGRVRAGTSQGPEAATVGSAESPVAPAQEGTGRER
jgi:lipopolysaccharide export system protein LptA